MSHCVKQRNLELLLRLGVLLFMSLFAVTARAVILVDNVSTVVDNNPTTLTQSHTTNAGSDRLMIVGVSLLNEDLDSILELGRKQVARATIRASSCGPMSIHR